MAGILDAFGQNRKCCLDIVPIGYRCGECLKLEIQIALLLNCPAGITLLHRLLSQLYSVLAKEVSHESNCTGFGSFQKFRCEYNYSIFKKKMAGTNTAEFTTIKGAIWVKKK